MGAAKETAFFRGEGGCEIEMDLPLSEVMTDKLTRGTLQRINEDGTPFVAASTGEHAAEGSDLTNGVPPKPAVNAPKGEWVGYAVRVHGVAPDDAEGMTKQDLIDLSKTKPDPVEVED